MKRKIILCIMLIAGAVNAQDMRQNAYASLFSDQKANRQGDALTIIVLESTQASNNSETNAGRKSDVGFGLSGGLDKTALPNVDFNVGSKNDFSGKGSTQTSGIIRTKISATVDSVLANGNLLIRGSKKIIINGEEQTIKVKGIVRPSDISPDNAVLSYNISDAELSFEGNGIISDNQKPGLLTKLFHWLF
ncbi:MAG: flagellar basal body L-ring protein [Ignavibacteriae bacterium HGW-Ignavibacteriae-3]|nr:MAG: flagellar basal body L-ring protein [Ignavibacteriae bacterium HGW-Ignavibacteriae-3]